ncbi:Ubiquitin-like_domain superfamily [Hexamita inflata]|uniref:Ubiquitin-like domain superfamily n=1 Tax=Hexamita inflata TaxID=28002 RepID=A0AA86QCL7_9EUKA|nr:Ubiquitin-like domain superfamily [Hexamita inflata]CAI9958125.1 Ubiquitin-like domain superfamily [Hexamita inflata]
MITIRVYYNNKYTKYAVRQSDKIEVLREQIDVLQDNPKYSLLFNDLRLNPQYTFTHYGISNKDSLDICKEQVKYQYEDQIEDSQLLLEDTENAYGYYNSDIYQDSDNYYSDSNVNNYYDNDYYDQEYIYYDSFQEEYKDELSDPYRYGIHGQGYFEALTNIRDQYSNNYNNYYQGERYDPGDGDWGEGNVKFDEYGHPYVD